MAGKLPTIPIVCVTELLKPFWQTATPKERSQEFREWVAQLPHSDVSLSDDAFDRDSIYD